MTTPYNTDWTFTDFSYGGLSFSSIISTETDYGAFDSFTDTAPDPFGFTQLSLVGMQFGGFVAGAYGPGSSTAFTLTYDVNADPTRRSRA